MPGALSRRTRPPVVAASVLALGLAGLALAPAHATTSSRSTASAARTTTTTLGPAVVGTSSWYALSATAGSCLYRSSPANRYTAAANPSLYAHSVGCGLLLRVTANHRTITVKVTDICPGCKTGNLDLSKQAFAALAPVSRGLLTSSYRVIRNPKPAGHLSFRVKEGSSKYWLALLVDHAGNPLSKVSVRTGTGLWHALSRTTYDHWLAPHGAGKGPFTVKVTDRYGHHKTVHGITLTPGRIQRTTATLY